MTKFYTLGMAGKRLQELLDENARLHQRIIELETLAVIARDIEVDCPNCGKTITVEGE